MLTAKTEADRFNEVIQSCGEAPLAVERYITCPFCGRPGKFRLYSNGTYHCFRPACGAHGDLYDYLVARGHAPDRLSAKAIVQRRYGYIPQEQRRKRQQALHLLYSEYRAQAEAHPEVLAAFARRRGYDPELLRQQKVGYAPPGWCPDVPLHLFRLVYSKGHPMEGRLVFPLYNSNGELEHLQGRALDPADPLRWLSTGGGDTPTVRHCLYNSEQVGSPPVLYLCEGITDTLSLLQLGYPAVGSLGLSLPLHHPLWQQTRRLIVLYDSDRHPDGRYKSWEQIIPQLVALQLRRPHLDIACATVPSPYGDLNEWLCDGLTAAELEQHLQRSLRPLWDWAYELLYPSWTQHPLLLQLCKHSPDLKRRLEQQLAQEGWSPVDYAQHLVELSL